MLGDGRERAAGKQQSRKNVPFGRSFVEDVSFLGRTQEVCVVVVFFCLVLLLYGTLRTLFGVLSVLLQQSCWTFQIIKIACLFCSEAPPSSQSHKRKRALVPHVQREMLRLVSKSGFLEQFHLLQLYTVYCTTNERLIRPGTGSLPPLGPFPHHMITQYPHLGSHSLTARNCASSPRTVEWNLTGIQIHQAQHHNTNRLSFLPPVVLCERVRVCTKECDNL